MRIKYLITLLFVSFISFCQSQITSEEIIIYNDSIELPGTLTYTKSVKKQALLIWVHGSGNVDRNGNQSGVNVQANYIKQFRDSVNKNDIAFFSYDKRTANPKNPTSAILKPICMRRASSKNKKKIPIIPTVSGLTISRLSLGLLKI